MGLDFVMPARIPEEEPIVGAAPPFDRDTFFDYLIILSYFNQIY